MANRVHRAILVLAATAMQPGKDAWETWGKRLGLIATAIAIVSALTGFALWGYRKIWNYPKFVIRQQKWTAHGKNDVFDLRFSFLNPEDEAIYLNSITFQEGFLVVSALPWPFHAARVPEYHDQVYFTDLRTSFENLWKFS